MYLYNTLMELSQASLTVRAMSWLLTISEN